MRPLLCSGPAPAGAYQLGGGPLWFTDLMAGERQIPASQLEDQALANLTGVRAPILGMSWNRPYIMGIVNATPDSFSDAGKTQDIDRAVAVVRSWGRDVDIIDVGGESTRPGAEYVPARVEINRVCPVILALRDAGIDKPISIDTRKAEVAMAALRAGADLVNDVSAMNHDPEMASLLAETGSPACLMHARGTPDVMQKNPQYQDVEAEVFEYLQMTLERASAAGIESRNIMLDPGIGFGKTEAHNLTLLRTLAQFHQLGSPLLVGVSRKGFIGTIGQSPGRPPPPPADRVAGSVAVAVHCAGQGAQVLRVHDVVQTAQALRLWRAVTIKEYR